MEGITTRVVYLAIDGFTYLLELILLLSATSRLLKGLTTLRALMKRSHGKKLRY